MVVGDAKCFPYRSSSYITKFFERCGLPFKHDGSTRPIWTKDRLSELNLGDGTSPDLPSNDLCRLISELFDSDDFDTHNETRKRLGETDPDRFADLEQALAAFNKLVSRQGLVAELDNSGRCFLRSTGTGASSADFQQSSRPLSQQEIEQRRRLSAFLDRVSEDEFIEVVLVPLFSASWLPTGKPNWT